MNDRCNGANATRLGVPAISDTLELCISIVAWRSPDLTIQCLRSLVDEIRQFKGCRVYVVDNNSADGSAEIVADAIEREGWGGWVVFIRSSHNGGFAYGNNIAIRAMYSSPDVPQFVLLLNPDTIVRPGALRLLLEFIKSRPEVGIAGGRSEDLDGTPQVCCFRFPNPIGEFAAHLKVGLFNRLFKKFASNFGIPSQPLPVGWVSGAFMIVRKEVIDQIGLMDESYFLYYEETDFTLRANRAGWTCWHVPESRVVHLVGQSSGVTRRDQAPKRMPAYWFDSRRRYFMLNYGRLYACVTDIGAMLGHTLSMLRSGFKRSGAEPPHYLRDFLRYSALVNARSGLEPRKVKL